MTFNEMLDQALALLQRRGRLTYRALQRQFNLDEAYLADLTAEMIQGQCLAVDEGGAVLVWTGGAASAPAPAPPVTPPAYLAEKILASRPALEGERKQVTVLFADLKGSMELLAERDPEEARQLLDPVLEYMMAAVHRYEGTVNQVMGDGIMALFGAPIAHEDHAVRACYAALAMQEALHRYAEEVRRTQGLLVQMRVGLNSGEVVVRAIGNDLHMDYSAIGQTTHLAARMEQLAAPGSILLTAATLRLVEGLVRVQGLGPVLVKGLAEPVEVFELVGATALRRRLQVAVSRGLSPFVGRQPEVEALQQALARAGAGQGQVVALLGEPGVGKSRLVYEFLHSHHTQGWLRLESSSVSYGKATAYLPVCDLLKAYCHIEDCDDLRTVRSKITGHILTLDETLQDTVPAVLALFEALPADSLFLALDPLQRRRRTLEALKRVLLRESQIQPLLLVFEDLHWIDSETQAVLDMLVESLPTARVLLLVNYRPEYQHGWGSKTYYTQLRLDPLPEASAESLLQALLGDDPALVPLTQLLIARTQGNPFFLEESVRTLVETEVLVGERGAYHLAQPLDTLQVPATVQALLAARIDRLPPEDKRLLQTAAVIGTEVPWPLLQAIADTSEEALYRSLAQLQAAEFLYETSLFPERVYTFKHALTHEVAYGSLLHERRRALHAHIVAALEALAGDRRDDQVERLAQHALRGAVWDKAVVYFRQAGTRALARWANQEAVVCFEQAIEALRYLPVSAYMAFHCTLMGDYHQAVVSGQRTLASAEALRDFPLQVQGNFYLAQAYHSLGDYRRAIDLLRSNVASLEGDRLHGSFGTAGLPSVTSRFRLTLCLAELGVFAEAIALGEEAVQIAKAVNHPGMLANAYQNAPMAYLRKGDFPKAIPLLERGVELCRSGPYPRLFAGLAATLGVAYALAGRTAEALPLLEQAMEPSSLIWAMQSSSPFLWVSEAYLQLGRVEDASRFAERAMEHARAHDERGHQAWALHLLGEIHACQESLTVEQAEAHYRQALALAEELGMRPLQAHCHRGLGTLYARQGQQEQARAALGTAIALYRDMEMTFWLPQAEAVLAQVG